MQDLLKGIKVLLLDDDLLTLELFEFALKNKSAEVRIDSCVAGAIATIKSWNPDILISDVNMPAEDGFSFIRKIRQELQSPSTPVIAVTGYGSRDDHERLTQSGFSKVMVKPVNPDQLIYAIKELLFPTQAG